MALSTRQSTKHRAQRVRRRLRKVGAGRPRLSIFRSGKNIYAQVIDDALGMTVAAASSLEAGVEKGSAKEGAAKVGALVAKRALDKGAKDVVFDRGGYIYHGRIKALAEAAREAGLNF
jgi:large subunit ribosomal protein L18